MGLGAGVAYGVSAVLIRKGVGELAPPLVGAAMAMLFGAIGLFLAAGRGVRPDLNKGRKSVLLLIASGFVAACGVLSTYFALSLAPVVVVTPVQSTTPIFTLLWSWLFLGSLEKITPRLVIGSFMVVGGIVLITLGMP